MKLKIHNRIYNWTNIREIYPSTKWDEGSYYPQIVIVYSNGEHRSVTFNMEEYKKTENKNALQTAQDLLDKAITEMA
jgi:hypothetical protein